MGLSRPMLPAMLRCEGGGVGHLALASRCLTDGRSAGGFSSCGHGQLTPVTMETR